MRYLLGYGKGTLERGCKAFIQRHSTDGGCRRGIRERARAQVAHGYALLCDGTAAEWRATQVTTVVTSTAEAEGTAQSKGTRAALYVRKLSIEMRTAQPGPTAMFTDSQTLSDQVQKHLHVGRGKHVDVQHHLVKQCLRDADVSLTHIASWDTPADTSTKPLLVECFWTVAGVWDCASSSCGYA